MVSDELAEVAKTYGTPRRTVLLESAGQPVTAAAAPLEVADDPCFVYLSSTGLLARTTDATSPLGDRRRPRQARRGRLGGPHHRPRRGRRAHQRGPAGQARRARPAGAAATANDPHLQGGAPVSEFLSLEPGERVLALTTLRDRRARASRSAPARASSSGSTPRCSATATTGR